MCFVPENSGSLSMRHLETLHPSHMSKPPDCFKRKLDEYCKLENCFKTTASVSSKAQLASYKVTYRIAKCTKQCIIHTEAFAVRQMSVVSCIETRPLTVLCTMQRGGSTTLSYVVTHRSLVALRG